MESNLTPKQKKILEWIEQYLGHNHTMPSRREIAEGVGLSSPATIQQHIEALEKKGFLKRGETRESRALQWTSRSKKLFLANQAVHAEEQGQNLNSLSSLTMNTLAGLFEVPLLGTIAAGYPIEVFPDARTMQIPLEMFLSSKQALAAKDDIYMLTVRGDSMIEEGIFSNDYVILRKSKQAKSGDTVAALLNGEATLKKLIKPKAGGLELHPANPRYPIMPIKEDDRFEVQGILVGIIRRFQN